MADPYSGREQTGAKHYILKHYLEELAFKVLTFSDITYVDGFSGPWKSTTESFSDSSFMIAITVLRDAQEKIFERIHTRRRIRCFFSETDPEAFRQLDAAVSPYHDPDKLFEIKTYHGRFEDAISEIQDFIGASFPLIFIDPTGWSGYPLETIKPLFFRRKCEVLINFMYDHVNRFAHSEDETIIASLEPILGGPGWQERLDPTLSRGGAVEKLFRESLKAIGRFRFVVSTKITKTTAERPHFFIVYGTKNDNGLKVFREIEYKGLRAHVRSRVDAKERKREEQPHTPDLFPGHAAEVQEESIDEMVEEQKALASHDLLKTLSIHGAMRFSEVVTRLLEAFMLRETNVKDICAALAKDGRIENTWGGGNRKPHDPDIIDLKERA